MIGYLLLEKLCRVPLYWKILFLFYLFFFTYFFFFFTYWIKTWVPNADLGDKVFWIKQQQSAAFGDLYQCTDTLNEYLSSSFWFSVNLSTDTLVLSLLFKYREVKEMNSRFSGFCCTGSGTCRHIHTAKEMQQTFYFSVRIRLVCSRVEEGNWCLSCSAEQILLDQIMVESRY